MERIFNARYATIPLFVAILVVNRWFVHRNTTALNDAVTQVAKTLHTLDVISDVLAVPIDAETGQRGYILTQEREFLEPYENAVARSDAVLARLAAETSGNPRQSERAARLATMIKARVDRLQQSVTRRDDFLDPATAMAAIKQGKQQMDAIRGLVGEMKAEEQQLLAERTLHAQSIHRVAIGANIITGTMCGFVIVGFAVYVTRTLAASRRDAAVIRRAHEDLQEEMRQRSRAEHALRESERIYRAIGESIDYGVWLCDAEGKNTYASPSFLQLVGLTQAQCSEFGWGEVLHPDDAERTIAAWKECVRTQGTWDVEHRFRGRDGQWHPVLARGVPVYDNEGELMCWAGINLDISRMKEAERELQLAHGELERRIAERTNELTRVNHELQREVREHTIAAGHLRERAEEIEALMDILPMPVWVAHDPQCRVITGNRAADELLRVPRGQNLSATPAEGSELAPFRAAIEGRELNVHELPVQRAAATGSIVKDAEFDVIRADGTVRHVTTDAVPLFDWAGNVRGVIASSIDITDQRALENKLRASLAEKEVLLKEIHHRVKNNLQVISSLLYLQSQQTGDELSVAMFNESQQRVRSMALVHERLYRTADLTQVDFADYVECLADSLFGANRTDGDRIRMVIESQGVKLPINTAVPCGLLVNELMSNCLKHAFPANEEGTITVSLETVDDQEIVLSVRDDGIGLPAHVEPETSPTFGMQIIMALVEQLHGSLTVWRAEGTEFRIRFPSAV